MTDSKLRTFLKQYWAHYIMLEEEVLRTVEYVSINKVNFDTFSMRYFMIFEGICSEVDALCKEVIHVIGARLDDNRMDYYCIPLREKYPDFIERKINCIDYDIVLQPWHDWGKEYKTKGEKKRVTPNWWKDYNACKHDRTATRPQYKKPNYMFANQENILNALAALYQLNM